MSGLEVRVVDNVVVVAEGFGPAGPQGPGVPDGGTTGQVLAKASNTDQDTVWQDPSGGGAGAAVLYTAQTLTAPQKAQARTNTDSEQAGAAAAAVEAHAVADDSHGDRAFATAADATHAAAAGAHPLTGVDGLTAALALLAPLLSPALSGTPTAPTAAGGTASTQIATTAFVAAAISALIGSVPGALDTLDELAAAMGDDPNFAASVTSALAGKLAKASNLADLVDAAAARGNLGAGTVGAQVFTASTAAAIRTLLELGGAALLAIGTTAGTAAAGDDARFSNARTPTAHAASHAAAGSDPIKLDDLATPDDNTDLNASPSAHGLLPKLENTGTKWLRDDGTWATVSASPAGSGAEMQYRNSGAFGAASGTHWDAANGRLSIGAGTSPAGVLHVAPDSASEIPGIFQGAASQTANLQEWRNSAGTVLSSVRAGGDLHLAAVGRELQWLAGGTWGSRITTPLTGANSGLHFWNGLGADYTTRRSITFCLDGSAVLVPTICIGTGAIDAAANFTTSSTPANGRILATGGSGTNIAGGTLYVGPGVSTGNATPGRVVLQATAAGSSGTTKQTLVDVLTVTDSTTLTANNAVDLAVGTTTGTKIGTATTQKLGFWNATPVVQQSAVADATDAASVITQLNSLLAKLRTVGIIAT